MIEISGPEFAQFQRFIHDAAGITIADSKKMLVSGRLDKRLRHHRLDSFGAYFRLITSGTEPDELQMAVDLLTTNETYFFREPKHFDLLREVAVAASRAPASRGAAPFRVWSAASSSGEEAYSIAMVLADCAGSMPWEVSASDISQRVLARARRGHYPDERAQQIPVPYLKQFCLKGTGPQQGTMLVSRALRSRVQFMHVNLNTALPALGLFDVIFLRNVMIYFSPETKQQIVARVLSLLKPGGYFVIGHSENLNGITSAVSAVMPSVYRKPQGGPP